MCPPTLQRPVSNDTDAVTDTVFHQANEALIITDAHNRVTHVNPAFTHLTGYLPEDIRGKTPDAFSILAQDNDTSAVLVQEELRRHGQCKTRVTYRHRDGELYPGLMSVRGVRNHQGELSHHVAVLADLSVIPAQARHLSREVYFDALTGLPNLQLLTQLIQESMDYVDRNDLRLAICTLDIDFFKKVNDVFGNDIGDVLLSSFSQRISHMLFGDDIMARVGGDEFVLLLHHPVDDDYFRELLAAIRKPLMIEGRSLQLSASLGVTLYPQDAAQGDVLLRHANQAMYRAKQRGRDTWHVFDPEHDRQLQVRNEQRQRFHDAIREDELRLHYQPQVDMHSGEVVGVEALVRWQHPREGLLSPAAFLPVIEATWLEVDLGEWVLDAALQQLVQWQKEDIALPISVNISPTHLLDDRFSRRLGEMLADYPQVSPGMLKLEVLESAALHDIEAALETMAYCQALGISFAIDDFGTGFSSLTHMRRLPVSLIKIDQSFVRDMLTDPDDMAIVESVIYMANRFSRPMLAEGVETLNHARALIALGCPLAQGYGIARPMPPAAMAPWLVDWQEREEWLTLATMPEP